MIWIWTTREKSLTYKNIFSKLKKEIPLIIMSLAIAVGLWYFNQLQYTQVRSFQVEPILQISDQMVPIRTPRAVTITIKGALEQLQSIDPNDFQPTIDLKGVLVEGEYGGEIDVVLTGVARHLKGIEVSFSPITIPIALERKITKPVKVKVITEGAVKAGYELEIGVPAPDEVLVTGPRSMMENLEFMETEPINLEKLTGTIDEEQKSMTIDQSVMLAAPFDGTASIVFNRDIQILYSCRIKEAIKQITVRDLYVNQIGAQDSFNYQLETEYVRLNLSGPELKLNRLNIAGLIIGIELDGIEAPGEYTIPVIRMFDAQTQEMLSEITDLGLSPSTIKVVVEDK